MVYFLHAFQVGLDSLDVLTHDVACNVRRNQMASWRCDGINLRVIWKVGIIRAYILHIPSTTPTPSTPHTHPQFRFGCRQAYILCVLVHVPRIHKFDKIILFYLNVVRLVCVCAYAAFGSAICRCGSYEKKMKYQRNQFIKNSNEYLWVSYRYRWCCANSAHTQTHTCKSDRAPCASRHRLHKLA